MPRSQINTADDVVAAAITRRHSWINEHWVAECADGNARTERECAHCHLMKITVHPPHGLPWREWRTKNGEVWQGTATPPCLVDVVNEGSAANENSGRD